MIIMTATEVRQSKLEGMRRELMGNDVRNHSGARSLVHKNHKKAEQNKRFGGKEKRQMMRGDW